MMTAAPTARCVALAIASSSWHDFASAILEGLKARGQPVKARTVHAITTMDFPTKAVRPANSRLDLSRLRQVFGVTTPSW